MSYDITAKMNVNNRNYIINEIIKFDELNAPLNIKIPPDSSWKECKAMIVHFKETEEGIKEIKEVKKQQTELTDILLRTI